MVKHRRMDNSLSPLKKLLLLSLIVAAAFGLAAMVWQIGINTDMGEPDFLGYWSAAYLLREGKNSYDPELMKTLEDQVLEIDYDFVIMAWNPPTLFVFFLPLTGLSFQTAKAVWLVINVFILMGTAVLISRIYLPQGKIKTLLFFLLFAISFPQVIVAMSSGQVTFWLGLSIAASMALIKREQWFWAGAVLIFTSFKPHIVLLAWIYLMLYIAQRRKYEAWAGFVAACLVCSAVLFIYRPLWISDLIGQFSNPPTAWTTPTIGGALRYFGITDAARYLIFLFLPLPFILAKNRSKFSLEFSVALLTVITIPTTLFGWSYDQSILFIPIAQVFAWLSQLDNKKIVFVFGIVITASQVLNYIHRAINSHEIYYLWIPIFWLVVFGIGWYLNTKSSLSNDKMIPVSV